MTSPDNQSTASLDTDFTKTWRYKVGLAMIIVGNGIILLALVMPALGAGAGTVGSMVLGGEVISLASIVFLGKEGFKAIKSKVFAFVKESYTGAVGPTRHYIGIALIGTSVAASYITALYLWTVFGASAADTPPPIVWGLDFAQQESLVLWLFVIQEISFLASIYVLGADWWGKFRRIFVWEASEG
jgi:hypothetical protein